MMNEYKLNSTEFVIQSPPGDTLLEVLESRSMAQSELALRTGRPLKTINEIIKGKAAITPETALQFERVLGISAAFWLNREQQYRESQARQAERKVLKEQLKWLEKFPILELAQLGWIKKCDTPFDQIQELLQYFGLAKPDDWLPYWTTTIPEIQNNSSFIRAPGSATAWLRKGELHAQALKCSPYNVNALREILSYLRDFMAASTDEFYNELVQMCAQAGVAFCVVQDPPGQSNRRLIRWLSPMKALLQLSASHTRPSEFWHSVYHGLGHILLHGKRDVFLEEDHLNEDRREIEADRFASGFLEGRDWTGINASLSWDILQHLELSSEEEWKDLAEETGPAAESSSTQPQTIDNLALLGWPGLSEGARRALLAAGMADEAGRVDEQLFSRWVTDQLDSIMAAFSQGYLRDALADLENLSSIVHIGEQISPALGGLYRALELFKIMIEQTAQPYFDPRIHLRGIIEETYQPIKNRMVSETRRTYSTVATKTESSLAEQLFHRE